MREKILSCGKSKIRPRCPLGWPIRKLESCDLAVSHSQSYNNIELYYIKTHSLTMNKTEALVSKSTVLVFQAPENEFLIPQNFLGLNSCFVLHKVYKPCSQTKSVIVEFVRTFSIFLRYQ